MIKTCLFDLDGTLLDTLESIKHFVNATVTPYGIAQIDREETKSFVGKGAKDLIKKVLKKSGIDAEKSENEKLYLQILDEYLASYNANSSYLTEPYEGICDLLSYLKGKGIRLAVISNKPKSTVTLLCDEFFPGVFDAVEGAREDFPLKPDPALALDILERLSSSPEECAYFGDTGTDMKTGGNLGAKMTVGVLWGFRDLAELTSAGATVTVERACEVKDFI